MLMSTLALTQMARCTDIHDAGVLFVLPSQVKRPCQRVPGFLWRVIQTLTMGVVRFITGMGAGGWGIVTWVMASEFWGGGTQPEAD